MDCPRCGFSQPKDQYCASCGLNVETYIAKPPPFYVRLLQNPTLHLVLLGVLIIAATGYIIYSQRDLVGREVTELFRGIPLLSRDANDPNEELNLEAESEKRAALNQVKDPVPLAQSAAPPVATESEIVNDPVDENTPRPVIQNVEVTSWEVPRDQLALVLQNAERVGESTGGRAYYWVEGEKASEVIRAASLPLGASRLLPSTVNSQLDIEASTAPADAFQFGMYIQVTKAEGNRVGLKWESTLILPQPQVEAGVEPVGVPQPTARTMTTMTLTGRAELTEKSALLILFEPTNRNPAYESISRLGDGPWSVFLSEAFRANGSDWITLLEPRLKKPETPSE